MSHRPPGSDLGGTSSRWVVERELPPVGPWRRWVVVEGPGRGRRLLLSIFRQRGAEAQLAQARRRIHQARGILHPALTRVTDEGEIADGAWAVEEIGDTMPLSVGGWRGRSALELVRVIEALGYVHQQGLVHGQVSADTVLSSGRGALLSGLVVGGEAGEPEADVRAWAKLALEVLGEKGPGPTRSPGLWQLLRRVAEGSGWVPGDGRRMAEQVHVALSADRRELAPGRATEPEAVRDDLKRQSMRKRVVGALEATLRGLLSTVLTVALLAGIGAATFLYLVEGGPREVVVPNLIGVEYEEAVKRLQEEGLAVGTLRRAYSDDVELNQLAAMNPPPGMRVRAGRRIDIVVSRGPAKVKVPRVVGLQIAEAEELLQKVGLALKQDGERRADAPAGEILSQRPGPGAMAGQGTEVAVIVSGGPDYGVVQVTDNSGETQTILFRELEIIVADGPSLQRVTVLQERGGAMEAVYDRPHRPGEKVTVPVQGRSGTRLEVQIEGKTVYKTQL